MIDSASNVKVQTQRTADMLWLVMVLRAEGSIRYWCEDYRVNIFTFISSIANPPLPEYPSMMTTD